MLIPQWRDTSFNNKGTCWLMQCEYLWIQLNVLTQKADVWMLTCKEIGLIEIPIHCGDVDEAKLKAFERIGDQIALITSSHKRLQLAEREQSTLNFSDDG